MSSTCCKHDWITRVDSFLIILENIPILRVSTVLLIEQLRYHSLAILVVFLLIRRRCECRSCRCNPSVTSRFCIRNYVMVIIVVFVISGVAFC